MLLFQIEALLNIFNKSLINFLNLKKTFIDKYNNKKLNVFNIYMLLLCLIFILPSLYKESEFMKDDWFHTMIEIFIIFYKDFIEHIIYVFNPQTYIDIINSKIMFAWLNYIAPIIGIVLIIQKTIIILILFYFLFKNILNLFKN